jgi:hypothetical protein
MKIHHPCNYCEGHNEEVPNDPNSILSFESMATSHILSINANCGGSIKFNTAGVERSICLQCLIEGFDLLFQYRDVIKENLKKTIDSVSNGGVKINEDR